MGFERRPPGPLLAGLVDYLWHVSDAPAHARERILPNGTPCLSGLTPAQYSCQWTDHVKEYHVPLVTGAEG